MGSIREALRSGIRPAICACLVLASAAEARPSVARLLRRLADAPSGRRVAVLRALGGSREKVAVEPLLRTLDFKSGDPRVTAAAVSALGMIGDARALRPLLDGWDYLGGLSRRQSLPPELAALREELLDSIGRLKGRAASAIVIGAIQDREPRIRRRAAEAAGRRRDREAVDALIPLVADADVELARAAAEALGDIGDPKAANPLRNALAVSDPWIAAAAAYGLARSGRPEGTLRLAESARPETPPESGVAAAYYLVKLGKTEGLDYLTGVARDARSPLRIRAVEAMEASGDPRVVLPLSQALGDASPEIRLKIVEALGRLGGARAWYALEKTRRGDAEASVRDAAKTALLDLGEYED